MATKVGITGGIGSGKSFVSKLIEQCGYPVYDSDAQAKQLMTENSELKAAIINAFGAESYNAEGLNRSYLSAHIFSNSEKRSLMNGIVHPVVIRHFQEWAEAQSTPLVFCESAILFESGLDKVVNEVVIVAAPKEICRRRVMLRDQLPDTHFQARYNSQTRHEENALPHYFIINNDDTAPLLPQIWDIIAQINSKA